MAIIVYSSIQEYRNWQEQNTDRGDIFPDDTPSETGEKPVDLDDNRFFKNADPATGELPSRVTADDFNLLRLLVQHEIHAYATGGDANNTDLSALTKAISNHIATNVAKVESDARDPLPTDDVSEGFSVGITWINTTTNESFSCINPAENAAVWVKGTLTADELDPIAISGSWNDLKNIPNSTTAQAGIAQMGTNITDEGTGQFGVSNATIRSKLSASNRVSYNSSTGAIAGNNATNSDKGVVQLTNSTNSTSQTLAATAKALRDGLASKAALTDISASNGISYNSGTGVISGINASTSAKGVVQLINSSTSTSNSLAPTANALRTGLNTRLDLSGGTLTGPLILDADPGEALGAATKQYVDKATASVEELYYKLDNTTNPIEIDLPDELSKYKQVIAVVSALGTQGTNTVFSLPIEFMLKNTNDASMNSLDANSFGTVWFVGNTSAAFADCFFVLRNTLKKLGYKCNAQIHLVSLHAIKK